MPEEPVVLYLVFPFLNEADNLPSLLHGIEMFSDNHPEYSVKVLAIDDGSTDGGASILNDHRGQCEIEVVVNEANLGPGRSFARAFSKLKPRLRSEDLVVTMEADNTSGLGMVSRMLVREREGYDVILASPYAYGGGFEQVSFFRVLVSHVANALVKVVLNIHGLTVFSSFFRLYRGGIIRRLQMIYGPEIIESPGFECMVELLYKLALLRARISEIEYRVDWGKRRGKSKMKILRTVKGYFRVFASCSRWRLAAAKVTTEDTEGKRGGS
ncbi:MAG TPA: glycosyltransferase [bacterium]|nr:glycosyltransferase [bacterium]